MIMIMNMIMIMIMIMIILFCCVPLYVFWEGEGVVRVLKSIIRFKVKLDYELGISIAWVRRHSQLLHIEIGSE